jgi:hypothetical protein
VSQVAPHRAVPTRPPPSANAGRRGRGVIACGVAAAAAALLLGWRLAETPPAPLPDHPASSPARSAARTVAATAAPVPRAPARARAVPASVAAVRAEPATPPSATGPEVCGWGAVQLPDDDPFPLQRIPAAVRRAALDEAVAGMGAHADPRVRAAALLIGTRSAAGGRARVDQLARLAIGSQDAVVYAVALQACQGRADAAAGACGLLGLAQAAQLEPDNAQPWLALAAEAAARQDSEAELDAMRRAAQATRIIAHPPGVPVLVARALDGPQAALQRTLALGVAQGLQDTWRLSPAGGAVAQARAHCLAGAPDADPALAARGPACRALALLLLQRGRGVGELGAGLDIARRWAFAPPGLSAWQQEHDALLDTAAPLPDGIDLGCGAQQQQLAWLQRVAGAGERSALREQLAASGHSIAEWSARHRRSLTLAQATAAAVADESDAEAPR